MALARIICLLALFCAFCIQGRANVELKRGLFFYSSEVNKDERTCLDLTPDKELVLKEGFSLEFDIQLRREIHNFGYIFRIIGNDSLNIDFLSDLYSSEANISLVVKNQSVLQFRNSEIYPTATPSRDMWIKVLFKLDSQNDIVSISLNGIKKESIYPLGDVGRFRICFGNNPHNIYYTTDVAPMTVKDIRLYDGKSNIVRYWPLERHSINCVYDECAQDKAIVFNPLWRVDSHIKWQKKKTFIRPGLHHQVAFDPKNKRIFIAKENTVLVQHMKDNHTDTIITDNGIPYNTKPDQTVYDSLRNELISYDFESNRLARFSFNTNNWDNEDNTTIEQFFMHHGRFYLAADSLLVTFGGYGFHKYYGLLQKYTTDKWAQVDLSSSVTPRYLGSMGYLGNREFLYFGGYGNESGKQEEFPRNYYDLYRINIDNHEVTKIWELSGITSHFTNSNALIVDQKGNRFYTLSYPNKRYASVITLHEYDMNSPQYRVVGDSIPYFFTDTESYCDLYQSLDQSELYAVVSYEKEGNSEINIYSIAYPPLNPEEIFQEPLKHSNKWTYLFFISIGFFALIYLFSQIKKKKKTDCTNSHPHTIVYEKFLPEKRPSSVSLLGDFQLIDKSGNDITSNLTPTGIQIFLLLLMFTIKNGRGILGEDIKNIIWFDKDGSSARNNRNVHINKLRLILKDEGIDIVKNEGYWTVVTDKKFFCDYERILMLIKNIESSNINKGQIDELLSISLKGRLLNRMQDEWLEPYQVEYSNLIIETLLKLSNRNEVKSDLMSLFKIADVILLHDNIDEDAIRLKCYALYHLGRNNQALQCYKKFVEDYQLLLATKYNTSFEELIEKKG
jgi:hypothetical protein